MTVSQSSPQIIRLMVHPDAHQYLTAYPDGTGRNIVSIEDATIVLDNPLSLIQVRGLMNLLRQKGLDADQLLTQLLGALVRTGKARLPDNTSIQAVTENLYTLILVFPTDLENWRRGVVICRIKDPNGGELKPVRIDTIFTNRCTQAALERFSLLRIQSRWIQWIKQQLAERGYYVFAPVAPTRHLTTASPALGYNPPVTARVWPAGINTRTM